MNLSKDWGAQNCCQARGDVKRFKFGLRDSRRRNGVALKGRGLPSTHVLLHSRYCILVVRRQVGGEIRPLSPPQKSLKIGKTIKADRPAPRGPDPLFHDAVARVSPTRWHDLPLPPPPQNGDGTTRTRPGIAKSARGAETTRRTATGTRPPGGTTLTLVAPLHGEIEVGTGVASGSRTDRASGTCTHPPLVATTMTRDAAHGGTGVGSERRTDPATALALGNGLPETTTDPAARATRNPLATAPTADGPAPPRSASGPQLPPSTPPLQAKPLSPRRSLPLRSPRPQPPRLPLRWSTTRLMRWRRASGSRGSNDSKLGRRRRKQRRMPRQPLPPPPSLLPSPRSPFLPSPSQLPPRVRSFPSSQYIIAKLMFVCRSTDKTGRRPTGGLPLRQRPRRQGTRGSSGHLQSPIHPSDKYSQTTIFLPPRQTLLLLLFGYQQLCLPA